MAQKANAAPNEYICLGRSSSWRDELKVQRCMKTLKPESGIKSVKGYMVTIEGVIEEKKVKIKGERKQMA